MISHDNLYEALTYMKTKDDVWERLKADFPDQIADLTSWKTNPNCSCGERLSQFFHQQIEANPNVLDKYITDWNEFNAFSQRSRETRQKNMLAGKLVEIDKGTEAWDNFVKTLAGKQFQMFSVVEREDKVAIYFL
tara:strand:+ start:864 stop:1268 length:405 start_codon:yes stop_codon:yes gene_type:complete